jgi:hypothetical protein
MNGAPSFSEAALVEHCERVVLARYHDARARGLTYAAALAEAAGLLWTLRPSLPAGIARRAVEELIARDRSHGRVRSRIFGWRPHDGQ